MNNYQYNESLSELTNISDTVAFDVESILDITSSGTSISSGTAAMEDYGDMYLEHLPPPEAETQEFLDVIFNDPDNHNILGGHALSQTGELITDLEQFIQLSDMNGVSSNSDFKDEEVSEVEEEEEKEQVLEWEMPCPKASLKLNTTLKTEMEEEQQQQQLMVNTPDVMNSVMELQQSFPVVVVQVSTSVVLFFCDKERERERNILSVFAPTYQRNLIHLPWLSCSLSIGKGWSSNWYMYTLTSTCILDTKSD